MGVTADHHPSIVSHGNARVKRSPFVMPGDRALFLEECFHIFNPLVKEKIFISVFEEKKDLPLANERE